MRVRTLPKVRVVLGKFQEREVTCRADCKLKYKVPEEKKTDVNIAVEILSDAVKAACESMVIVSGDSDVQPPIEWVKRYYPGIKITVYIPALPQEQAKRRLDYYEQLGINCRFLPLSEIKSHQLPDKIRLGAGRLVIRPSSWA